MKLKLKSKKAFTLVEMIVSVALIALVSMLLLGLVVPAANQQAMAETRNKGVHSAAAPLEQQAYTGLFSIQNYQMNLGNNITSTGTLYKSTDTKSGVSLWVFVPVTQ